jgi:hypothetical protein
MKYMVENGQRLPSIAEELAGGPLSRLGDIDQLVMADVGFVETRARG